MDFWKISSGSTKKGVVEVYPKFIVGKSKDLMIRGGDFYAFWLESEGRWSTDEDELIRVIDKELNVYIKENASRFGDDLVTVKYMWDADSGMINKWHTYCQKQMRDNYVSLDETLVFANNEVNKEDYSSKRLPYSLETSEPKNWNQLLDVLYSEEERHKIEWAIGSIVTGASKTLQKFFVFYGPPGSGKSTILNIIQMLFDGYYAVFEAETLGSANAEFALEQFKANPVVAICHDGDLSHIEKNTRLNSLVSHEKMTVNEKHKSLYFMKFISMCLIGTNKPVRITDAKSGINRRLIDITPTGNKLPMAQYNKLMDGIAFELGAIANKCKMVFLEDPNYYNQYKPLNMMSESNDFFNYVEDCYPLFKKEDGVSLKQAWELYNIYNEDAKVLYPLNKRLFKAELANYFRVFNEREKIGDEWIRSYYSGFKTEMFEVAIPEKTVVLEQKIDSWLDLKEQKSLLDEYLADMPAQYANDEDKPVKAWDNVTTKLKDIDTSKVHYSMCPEALICMDFDLKDEDGNKSYELNLKAASKFPKTYAETSKGGGGIHLHYWYDGDVSQLSREYADGIEIKVFTGKSSLRRRVSKCNNEDIAHISSGLPLREVKSMSTNWEGIKDEAHLINIIRQNLNKEYGSTTVSINYIYNALEEAYNSGIPYDVSRYYQTILEFANHSTNNRSKCKEVVCKMKFMSENKDTSFDETDEKQIVFYDVEVFPNLLLINWKKLGVNGVHRMINPTPKEVSILQNYRLVGFNCRKYDNHIIWARMLGYSNEQLYQLSQDIIVNGRGFFGKAYNLSYTDIYDYASKKQSLKKWEIELGIIHMELGLPWDKPVPEENWEKVAEYCDNDVISTEKVWEATQGDFTARKILADLAGMSVNDTTNSLTTRIIFGDVKNPQLVYTDLSLTFPGYEYVKNVDTVNGIQKVSYHNMYRGDDLGLGGWVYTQPGMYGNVALLDIASLHPTSLEQLNYLGEFTKNFSDIKQTRIYIKHKEYDNARVLFGGKLSKYLDDPSTAKQLSQALKIAINSVYGLTSAKFDNPFRDKRNVNNIVALRGALFMRTLQDEVAERGFKVIHIKTDSIKIADANTEIIDFCMEFAKSYGYTFEHEATYDRICLVNKAVYIAKYSTLEQCENWYGKEYVHKDKETCAHNKEEGGSWTATGTQFQIPYVFKKCFTKEDINFRDLCEVKEVKTAMYLNMNEEDGVDNLIFIGRVGLFCPILPGKGGGLLVAERPKKNTIGYDAVVGTKGYRWREAEDIRNLDYMSLIDLSYYKSLVDEAIDTINQFGDYEWFISEDPYQSPVYINGRPDYEGTRCIPF